ncbi:hypothetical protein [Companilactobacillus mishanensis]|uniref:hypothetical protein n=1 Tax=Companilactobacillus mishanensis TaxID=2486008 RepID=UPI0012951381|nr:hypothetical protein [Companilactobacillus mishanensis]
MGKKPFSDARWNEDPLLGAKLTLKHKTPEEKRADDEFLNELAKMWGVKRTPKSK